MYEEIERIIAKIDVWLIREGKILLMISALGVVVVSGSILPLFLILSLGINVIYFVLLDRLMMASVQRRTGP